jgi:hypothetical protein
MNPIFNAETSIINECFMFKILVMIDIVQMQVLQMVLELEIII